MIGHTNLSEIDRKITRTYAYLDVHENLWRYDHPGLRRSYPALDITKESEIGSLEMRGINRAPFYRRNKTNIRPVLCRAPATCSRADTCIIKTPVGRTPEIHPFISPRKSLIIIPAYQSKTRQKRDATVNRKMRKIILFFFLLGILLLNQINHIIAKARALDL